ncbi:hypothetical protein Ga0074812_13252 [Parafrankia irregularis]|uniref:Uncharacterized protein n=1 Tax=Parafrankia irregularis TaxID=795642 RepID=A0A0S4QW84_9ACTN|nr:hypothetical protein Ga0074812_13252 [Parafrankia irregularis]
MTQPFGKAPRGMCPLVVAVALPPISVAPAGDDLRELIDWISQGVIMSFAAVRAVGHGR